MKKHQVKYPWQGILVSFSQRPLGICPYQGAWVLEACLLYQIPAQPPADTQTLKTWKSGKGSKKKTHRAESWWIFLSFLLCLIFLLP